MRFLSCRKLWSLPLLLLAFLGSAQIAGAQTPLMVPREELTIPLGDAVIGAVALSDDGRRLYVGLRQSPDRNRMNLIVARLDGAGRVIGAAKRYRESLLPLPMASPGGAAAAGISALVVDSARRKLYVASSIEQFEDGKPTSAEARLLQVYDLDATGDPVGMPRSYDVGGLRGSLDGLARHPRLDLLYMAGRGGADVYAYGLDRRGEPQGKPAALPIGGQGFSQITITPNGERMILGGFVHIRIVPLDAAGQPAGRQRAFEDGTAPGHIKFAYTPHALFVSKDRHLSVWPFDDEGYPHDNRHERTDLAQGALLAAPAGDRLWMGSDVTFTDAITGLPAVEGAAPVAWAVGPNGALQAASQFAGVSRRQVVAGAMSATGQPVFITRELPQGFLGNRTRDYRVRVTILDAGTTPLPGPAVTTPQPLWIGVGDQQPKHQQKLGDIAVGQTSPWLVLDDYLRDTDAIKDAWVSLREAPRQTMAPGVIRRLKVRIEVAEGDPAAGGRLIKTLTDQVMGDYVAFFLPGYGFLPVAGREAAIGLLSTHAERYAAQVREVGLMPAERPRLYPIGAGSLVGGQGHLEQLQLEAETVATLGFNMVNCYGWDAIPPRQIDAVLDAFGLERRSIDVNGLPAHFDFENEISNPAALGKFATLHATVLPAVSGAVPGDVQQITLSNAPVWYYPTVLRQVSENPQQLAAFRAYLQSLELTPAALGQATWDKVFPLGAGGATDLPSRKLFYYTARFFAESAARGFRQARIAWEAAFGHPLTMVTPLDPLTVVGPLDVPGGAWYGPSNIPTVGPDTAIGRMDWFEAGRTSSHAQWTTDGFPDGAAQLWSYKADLMRSAAMLGDQQFGGSIQGTSLGDFQEGVSYKILSLLGHGAKALDVPDFGPAAVTGSGTWSDNQPLYRPLAQAMRRVARAERLMFPGRPVRGKIAILMPGSSNLWDKAPGTAHYQQELVALHHALIYSGYTVDFIDEYDVGGGALTQRGYQVLYVTGPNLARRAQEQVQSWVRAGGTLIATPGAAVADEFDSSTSIISTVLQLTGRVAVRNLAPDPMRKDIATGDRVTFKEKTFGAGTLAVYGAMTGLQPRGANIVATFANSEAAITAAHYGKGRAYAYGFFPGWQYWLTPNRAEARHLPRGWGEPQRKLAVAPVALAKPSRPATANQIGVEICRLQSPQGIALVLLNWSGRPLPAVTITIPATGKFKKVSSIETGEVFATNKGTGLEVTVPLKTVDVLLVE